MFRPDLGSELVGLDCLGVWLGCQVERHQRLCDPRRRHRRLDLHVRLRCPATVHPVRPGLRRPIVVDCSGSGHAVTRVTSNRGPAGPAGRHARTDDQRRGVGAVADAAARCRADVDGAANPATETERHQPPQARPMIRHPLAWGAWATAVLAGAFIDRNPYLQALLLLVVINVYLPYRGRRRAGTWKFALALALVPVLFSAALSRFGQHVLFTLPAIPIIGGRWTLDAVAFGASTGLALLLTVAVFTVLQTTVRSADVLAIIPRPLYRAGTTLALALAFAPKTLVAFQSIREARQLRGQRTGWRSAPELLLPLLLTTLERALQYGESLDARGFGSRRRSRYRPLPWSIPDVLVLVASLIAIAAIAVLPPVPYNPYLELAPGVPNP